MDDTDPTWNQLFEHRDFARRIALSLARQEGDAQDALQETWLRALGLRGGVGNPRAYLATVLRRGEHRRERERRRRLDREREGSRPEALPSTSDWVEALETQRRILTALEDLPETVREALMLRFYERQPPRRIAAIQGVGAETVRSRIRRGIQSLRRGLGDGESDGSPRSRHLAWVLGAPRAPWLYAISGRSVLVTLAAGILLLGLAWKVVSPRANPGDTVGPESMASLDRSEARGNGSDGSPGGPGAGDPRRAMEAAPDVLGIPGGELGGLVGQVMVSEAGSEPRVAGWGRFELAAEGLQVDGPGLASIAVEIVSGTFELRGVAAATARTGELTIHSMHLEGRAAVPRFRGLRLDPGDGGLRIDAEWRPEVELRVVDDATGRDLENIRIYRHVLNAGYGVYPMGLQRRHLHLDGVKSPLLLSSLSGRTRYWVTAPGYLWSHAFVDHGTPGSREVRLRAGGAGLRVDLGSSPIPEGLCVRLYPSDTAPAGPDSSEGPERAVADAEVVGGLAEFHGIPAGAYDVRAEIGPWHGSPWSIAEGHEVLVSGSMNEHVLEFGAEALPPAPVPLGLSLELPGGMRPEELGGLRLEPSGRPAFSDGDDWAFDLRRAEFLDPDSSDGTEDRPTRLNLASIQVTPGDYRFSAWGLGFESHFHVPASGLDRHTIVIPEVVEVTVRVLIPEELRGERERALSWRVLGSPGSPPTSFHNLPPGPEGEAYRIRVPRGSLELCVRSDRFCEETLEMEARSGMEDVEVHLRPAPGFLLRLIDGEAAVPLHPAVGIHLDQGGERRTARGVAPGGTWVQLDRVGPVDVHFDPIHGFEDPGVLTVMADLGWNRVLEVPLRRVGH